MKLKLIFCYLFLIANSTTLLAQVNSQNYPPAAQEINNSSITTEKVIQISDNLTKVTKSIDNLNIGLTTFFSSFSTNQGIKLTEKQQKLLLGFEMLNRAEQRIANLQKLKLDLLEKQSEIRLNLAKITDDLLPESIDRYVSTRGTTNAEQLRDIRRQALNREKNDLNNVLYDIQNSLNETNEAIRQTEQFLKTIRNRIFPEIEKELSDL